jgi:SAM-dependent methyltransferase
MLRHAECLAATIRAEQSLTPQSLVVEVGSNDGYLLQYYRRSGIPVLGIDPARNIAAVAREKGIETLNVFFGSQTAALLCAEGKQADVLHAHNVLAHVADQNDFVEGIRMLLKPNGIAIIETPNVIETINHGAFDQIYHEHLCYFSLTSLVCLCARHHLAPIDVAHTSLHGGSLLLTIGHKGSAVPSAAVAPARERERAWGVGMMKPYAAFARRTVLWKHALCKLLHTLKGEGKSIAAYGASAKGCTLLHYCDLGRETVDYVVDRSTVKQGRFTPGTHLPILPPEELTSRQPDFVLLLTWNFAEEIFAQQAQYLARGGAFILPFPEPRVVYDRGDALHRDKALRRTHR